MEGDAEETIKEGITKEEFIEQEKAKHPERGDDFPWADAWNDALAKLEESKTGFEDI